MLTSRLTSKHSTTINFKNLQKKKRKNHESFMIKLENLKEILRKFTVEKNCRLCFQNYCGKWDGEVAIYPLKKHSSILGLLGLVYLSTSILGTTFALISNIKFKNFFFCKSLPQYSKLLWCSNITVYKKRKLYII